jgi:fatty-acyl-CoA synthase
MKAQPGVSQAYVVGIPDERWGEIGCACVVRGHGSTLTEEGLIIVCWQRLARFKVPKAVLFLSSDDLPTTATGKVQKFLLPGHAAAALGERRSAAAAS